MKDTFFEIKLKTKKYNFEVVFINNFVTYKFVFIYLLLFLIFILYGYNLY